MGIKCVRAWRGALVCLVEKSSRPLARLTRASTVLRGEIARGALLVLGSRYEYSLLVADHVITSVQFTAAPAVWTNILENKYIMYTNVRSFHFYACS